MAWGGVANPFSFSCAGPVMMLNARGSIATELLAVMQESSNILGLENYKEGKKCFIKIFVIFASVQWTIKWVSKVSCTEKHIIQDYNALGRRPPIVFNFYDANLH